jgi:hypothetical protein
VIEIKGAEQLAALSTKLKAAGDRELKRELSKGITQAMKPVPAAARASALKTLPRRGGLAQRVAKSQMRTVRRAGNRTAGIRLQAKDAYRLGLLDRGFVRHPVFGNRDVWRGQRVNMGWWTTPTEAAAPLARSEVEKAMQTVANKI